MRRGASIRRLTALLAATALSAMALCSLAQADPSEYGIEFLKAAQSTSQAGAHADLTISFGLNTEASGKLPATTNEVTFELPPGLADYPAATVQCTTAQLMSTDPEDPSNATGCPQDAQIGVAEAQVFKNGQLVTVTEPLFNMDPPQDGSALARVGFIANIFPIVIDVGLRSESDYGAEVKALGTSSLAPLLSAKSTVWGVPAEESHDTQRVTPYEAPRGGVPETPNGKRSSGLPLAPFLANPTRCGVARPVKLTVASYAEPDRQVSAETSLAPISGCGKLHFEPSLSLTPSSHQAALPTGLDAESTFGQDETPKGNATSAVRAARVILPPQLSVAAGQANGLEGCSEAQVGFGSREAAHCPEAAKIGTAEVLTPALTRPLHGAVYVRQPTPGELIGIWLVVDEQGLHLKLRGKVHTDPNTGQITTVFEEGTPQSEGLPQAPVSRFSLVFFGGPGAPIAAPRHCGTYFAHYEFTPWSGGKAVSGEAPISFEEGCDTGGFSPKLSGGSTEPLAGAYATFLSELSRESGEQEFDSFDLTLPPGLVAKLAGVGLCEGQGATSGDCPPSSQIGTVTAAAGPGSAPLWIPQPGKEPTAVYLSGPYQGAPYSAIAKIPAQAGPFDLGDVITRAALHIDPESARVTAKSDPLPRYLEGIPTSVRRAIISVDRPGFSLNPTDCSPEQISALVRSTEGASASPSAPFGVSGCRGLPFKPSFSFKLKGKQTKRGGHPALQTVIKARLGDANIVKAKVALPHSEFLDQAHFKTICTRVQFAAQQCPAGSIYGHVTATSPLLDYPLEGPLYLRSSSHPLPDPVVVLKGPGPTPLEVNAVGQVDSVNGGLRVTFNNLPDAPLSKVVVKMAGGQKGLFVNSRDVCASPAKVKVDLIAHSGKRLGLHPPLVAQCG